MYLLRDTPVTPYTHLPVFTDSAICHILPSLLNSTKFCQDYNLKPILPHTYINWVIKSIIYTPSPRFFISFPYIIFWFYYTVYVHSLIISTLLYIIATYTYSVTIPPVRFLVFKHRTYIILIILILSEIIPIYSYYIEKKLIYIIIITPFSY